MGISVQVDGVERLERLAESAKVELVSELHAVSSRLERILLQEIKTVFRAAFASAGSGFPAIYRRHVLDTIDAIPISAEVYGYTIEITFDLDDLGNYDDLSQGFHYQARTVDGDYVELPYEGQALKSSFAKRYAYWRKIARGDVSGRAETYAERVSYWESIGKAPEWLLVQYGTTTEPYISPYPLVEEINASISVKASALMEQAIDTANAKAFHEYYQKTSFNSKPEIEYLRDPATGRFAGSKRRG